MGHQRPQSNAYYGINFYGSIECVLHLIFKWYNCHTSPMLLDTAYVVQHIEITSTSDGMRFTSFHALFLLPQPPDWHWCLSLHLALGVLHGLAIINRGGWWLVRFVMVWAVYIHNTNALSFRYVSPTLLIIIIGAMTLGCVVSSLCSGGWERRCLHMQWKGGLIV